MKDEMFFGLGRGYTLVFFAVSLTAIMSIIVLLNKPGAEMQILNYWKDFLTYFVAPVIGGKIIGKVFESKKK